MGTVDYTWHTPEVVPVRVLDTLPIGILRQMAGLVSKAYLGPVRVLDTLPIHILRQMGGLPSKAYSGRVRVLDTLPIHILRQMGGLPSKMTQDQSSSTLDTKASPRPECIKTTPKKDEETEGIEDVDSVDEDIDHGTLAIDVEKLEENANNRPLLYANDDRAMEEMFAAFGKFDFFLRRPMNCHRSGATFLSCLLGTLTACPRHTRDIPVRVLDAQPIDILRQMGGPLDKKELGSDVVMAKVDAERYLKAASNLGIKGYPTMLLFVNGSSQANIPVLNLGIKGMAAMAIITAVFCCVAALAITGSLHQIDKDLLGWWLCERQDESGGLNGRLEKLPDVGYHLSQLRFCLNLQEIVIWASKKMGESVIRVNSDIRAKEFLKKHSMIVVGLFEKVEKGTLKNGGHVAVSGRNILFCWSTCFLGMKEVTLGKGQRDDQETGAAAEPWAVPTPNANAEYFTTIPPACDASSLPKYTPSKEIDTKLRNEDDKRKEVTFGRGQRDDQETGAAIQPRAVPAPNACRAEADDDYNSPGNEDDRDYESDDSFEQEVVMQPGTSHLQRAPTRTQHDVSPIRERVTWLTPHPDVGTITPQPLDVEQKIQAAPFVTCRKYKKLKTTKGVEYARSHPPSGVSHEQWIGLIDKKWSDTKFWLLFHFCGNACTNYQSVIHAIAIYLSLFCIRHEEKLFQQVTSSSVRLVSSITRELRNEWHATLGFSMNAVTANATQEVVVLVGGDRGQGRPFLKRVLVLEAMVVGINMWVSCSGKEFNAISGLRNPFLALMGIVPVRDLRSSIPVRGELEVVGWGAG
ncbi:hypothetical protein RHMOL_Rhmol06G0205300 [Rhododendron molle]|uniref:Uncharacterized protein n=1 Tax=Rhododendron molle TaxID=49168 RepID=A0ACC0NEQ0_RHOML|nr:hypothetical protein RHMOL_Rhmol06G0205300 [Rhododendron molle]